MRHGLFGRRRLDRFVHILTIFAFAVNFAFVLISGYFIGRFVKMVDDLKENLRLIRGVTLELENERDKYIERCNPTSLPMKSRQINGES